APQVAFQRLRDPPHPRPRVFPGAVRRTAAAVEDPLHFRLEEPDVDLLVLQDMAEVGPEVGEEPREFEPQRLVAVEVDGHRVPLLRHLREDGHLYGYEALGLE